MWFTLVITQVALHFSRALLTFSRYYLARKSPIIKWSELIFGCYNPTGFYKQGFEIGTVPSSSSTGLMAPVKGCSAFRVAHTAVADGLEQAAVAEGALIAAHRVRRLAAAPERDAVRRGRRSLYTVAGEFLKHIQWRFTFTCGSLASGTLYLSMKLGLTK